VSADTNGNFLLLVITASAKNQFQITTSHYTTEVVLSAFVVQFNSSLLIGCSFLLTSVKYYYSDKPGK
jgi:hypothetical protein